MIFWILYSIAVIIIIICFIDMIAIFKLREKERTINEKFLNELQVFKERIEMSHKLLLMEISKYRDEKEELMEEIKELKDKRKRKKTK